MRGSYDICIYWTPKEKSTNTHDIFAEVQGPVVLNVNVLLKFKTLLFEICQYFC